MEKSSNTVGKHRIKNTYYLLITTYYLLLITYYIKELKMGKEVSLNNGATFYYVDELSDDIIDKNWQLLTAAMDDDVREKVHLELAPCTNREFLTSYLKIATEDLIIG